MTNESIWFDCNVMLPGDYSYPIWAWKEGSDVISLSAACPADLGYTHWTQAKPPPRPFTEAEKNEARHETHSKAEQRALEAALETAGYRKEHF